MFEIRNRIQCCLKKNAPVFNLKAVFQSRKWLSMLFTFKDKISKMLHSNLVYKFKYNICNDIYCGKTKHHFKVGACEHLGITHLTGKKVKSQNESAVFDHIVHIGHNASLMILKPLPKSVMNSDSSSESDFWYCTTIHLWIDMLSPSLWNFFHDYLQFSFII